MKKSLQFCLQALRSILFESLITLPTTGGSAAPCAYMSSLC
jgi:hypothetical protein